MKKVFRPLAALVISSFASAALSAADEALNGCIAADAVDLTGAGTSVVISFTFQVPALKMQLDPGRMCLRIRPEQKIAMQGTGVLGGPMMVGGTVEADGSKTYDKSSPIQPGCFNGQPPNPNRKDCYSGGTWPCMEAACKPFTPGAYGFYNNSNGAQKGALYVLP